MKFLFKALMKDGSIIEQTPEDKSQTTEGKNAFFDVLSKIDQVEAFALYNTETDDEHLVSLTDGHFEINGVPFYMHNEAVDNLRLVFFKRNTINFTTREILPVMHVFGFQCNLADGSNQKYLMTLI